MLFSALAGGIAASGGGIYSGALAVIFAAVALYNAPTRDEIVDMWAEEYEANDDG